MKHHRRRSASLDRRIRFHEAGHAVVAAALCCPVRGVYIDGPQPMADTRLRKPYFDQDELRRSIAVSVVGYLAERRVVIADRAEALRGAREDFEHIDEHWRCGHGDADIFEDEASWRRFVGEQVRMAHKILRRNWT